MKNNFELKQVLITRKENLVRWMKHEQIDLVVFQDSEDQRSASIRYLCGHPMDALFFIFQNGRTVLVPWDINLAKETAQADAIVPQEEFGRDNLEAIVSLCNELPGNSRIELPSRTTYPFFEKLRPRLQQHTVICRGNGAEEALLSMRMIKDSYEQKIYAAAGVQTDTVLSYILDNWDTFKTESDIAVAIETEGRRLGAEGTGFESIVAGPERSWGIHAFPSYGSGTIEKDGFTLMDFGLVFGGYTSDITSTVAKGRLTPLQDTMMHLVQEAYDTATSILKPGISTREVAATVTKLFEANNQHMPHSLGHGIGLDAHEYPFIRDKKEGETKLKPGMVITIEPGLYHPEAGGIRLENDFLITETGARNLTNSRIHRIP